MAHSTQVEALRHALTARLEELRGRLRAEVDREAHERFRDIAGEVTDAGDASVGDELSDTENTLIGLHVEEVRDIEAALQRIADGTFGRCIDCGLEIEPDRLSAYPTCKRCQICQQVTSSYSCA